MDKFTNIINEEFQYLLQSYNHPEYHLFFDSFKWFNNAFNEWKNDYKTIADKIDPTGTNFNYNPNIDLSKIKTVNNCTYIPSKTISNERLEKIHSIIADENVTDFNEIIKNLEVMFDYNLPSTISNLNEYLEKHKHKQSNNILIVGAGPVGLYTALYLDEYYNKKNITKTFVNILLIDNRIYDEGIRLPYSRITQFGFDIDLIQPFIKNIYCWKNKLMSTKVRQFDFINTLENLLYLSAYDRKIPMYFTKKYETFDKIKEFAKENNFQYIFDCSGGRLNSNLIGDVVWDKFKFKKDNMEVKYVGNNMYRFYVDNKEYDNPTVVLQLYDKNGKPFSFGNIFGFITNLEDLKILNKYKNKCFIKDDYLKIMRHFKSDNLRYLFQIIVGEENADKIKYIKITTFSNNSHHVNKVAQKIDKNLTYIGLGNTLGYSEYGIYFGLRSGILFSRYICNLLPINKYL